MESSLFNISNHTILTTTSLRRRSSGGGGDRASPSSARRHRLHHRDASAGEEPLPAPARASSPVPARASSPVPASASNTGPVRASNPGPVRASGRASAGHRTSLEQGSRAGEASSGPHRSPGDSAEDQGAAASASDQDQQDRSHLVLHSGGLRWVRDDGTRRCVRVSSAVAL